MRRRSLGSVDVELRHLRAFVAVAEELNFTRAARRLFIAQQALSTQIRQLEERIGVRLVTRTTRRVELTDAGRVLFDRAVAVLASVDELVASTRVAGGERPTLTVGFVSAANQPAMVGAMDAFAQRRPDVDVRVRFGDLMDPSGGLRDHVVDVAFVYGPFDSSGIERRLLYAEPCGVAAATSHHLAARDVVPLDALLAEPMFEFPSTDRAWRDFWEAAEHRTAPVSYVAQFRSLDALVQGIRSGQGVHVATRSLVENTGASAGIVWRPVTGLPPLEHFVAWRTGDARPLVHEFVETVTDWFRS